MGFAHALAASVRLNGDLAPRPHTLTCRDGRPRPPLTLHLRAADYPGANPITCTITLEIGDECVPALLTASLNAAPFDSLLPIFRAIFDELTTRGIAREAGAGRAVSRRAGCGACCRQAVPIAPSEARALAVHVAEMPKPWRSRVRSRFAAARTALDAAGVDHTPASFSKTNMEERIALGMAYFNAGIACPFLEDESCSIHPVRLLACREYLVTTPAAAFRTPTM